MRSKKMEGPPHPVPVPRSGDEQNAGFGAPEHLVDHKPGFDLPPAKQGVEEGWADGVEVVHAAGSGDDTLVALAAGSDEPVVLVSADRELAERARRTGAEVVGPTWLLDQLPPPPR